MRAKLFILLIAFAQIGAVAAAQEQAVASPGHVAQDSEAAEIITLTNNRTDTIN